MPAKGIGYNPTKNKKPKAKKVLKDEKGTFEWDIFCIIFNHI